MNSKAERTRSGMALPVRMLASALCAATIAGCASVEIGAPFDLQAFDANVRRGVTTRAQVQTWLGAPPNRGVDVEPSGEKFEQWTYYYGSGELPRLSGSKWKSLQIRFDTEGVVRAYNWSGNP
jgi:outer membrane protein assembly factor BamE (lipoprotein component of BamABCDE complex)